MGKTLILEKLEGRRKRGRQRMRRLDSITDSMDMSLSKLRKKVKEQNEKAGLKLSIQKTKIMASGPVTSWKIDGETI